VAKKVTTRGTRGHGSVRQMPSGKWQARFPRGVGDLMYATFDTKGFAQDWLAARVTDKNRGIDQSGSQRATVTVPFGDYAADWLKNREVKGRPIAARTRDGYQDLLDRFILPTFENKPVQFIAKEDVDAWYRRTARNTPTYRARAYSLLRTILANAMEDGFIPPGLNPARIRGAGSVEREHKVEVLEPDEYRKLLAAISARYKLMVDLATWCALRFGELTELRRGDLDLKHGVIRVRRAVVMVDGQFIVKTPKSAAGQRDVAIPDDLMDAVRKHLLEHTAPGAAGLLFPARNDPKQHLKQSTMFKVFSPARKTAGRENLRFHDLRHTGAVLAAQEGATPAELMARLGHSTMQASMRYQHAASGRDAMIAAKLSERRAEWRKEEPKQA
jgi:integrase